MRSAGLREARLVNDSRYNALVDPRRRGADQRERLHGRLGRTGREVRRQALRAGRHRRARVELRGHRRLRLPHALFLGQRRAAAIASAPEGTTRQVSEPRQQRRVAGKAKRRHWAAAR